MNNARLFRVFPDFSEIFFQIQYDNFNLFVHASRFIMERVIDTSTERTRTHPCVDTIKL